MKNLVPFLIMMGISVSGAIAQNTKAEIACGKSSGKVCKTTSKKGKYCYKTPYAQNFDICKNQRGYYVCCETPNEFNSAFSQPFANEDAPYRQSRPNEWQNPTPTMPNMAIPQSQSYPFNYTPSGL